MHRECLYENKVPLREVVTALLGVTQVENLPVLFLFHNMEAIVWENM